MVRSHFRSFASRLARGSAVLALTATPALAAAQEATPPAPPMADTAAPVAPAPNAGAPGDVAAAAASNGARGAAAEEIVVTGSRIARSGFTAPTPVTVVGQERLQQRAITNVADALNELPSFRALVSPATQQAAGGNIGARVLDLRGLGATRTLVLLDGKRFVPSTTQGTIDINLIPSVLVSRTEVVTGGASAAYGSDAVAGVVNFILDRSLTGLRASAQTGVSERGDAQQYNLQFAYGTPFAGDRGHAVFAAEYDKSEGMGDCYSRPDWCPNEMLVGNSRAGDGGYPSSVRAGPNGTGNLSQDGLVNSGVTRGGVTSTIPRGITFNRDGTTRRYRYGQIIGTNPSPLFMVGGEGAGENGYLQGILLIPPVERFVAYGTLAYELSDALDVGLDLSYGRVDGKVVGSQARDAAFVINRNNAFLPGQLAGVMDANNLASVNVGRVFGDLGGSVNRSRNETYRGVLSLRGRISDAFKWDAYYQYGRNEFRQDYTGNVVIARMRNAVNAVNSGGNIVCAINADASPANDDPSCQPFNLFGRGNSTEGARNYVAPSGFQTINTNQHVVAGNVQGDLFQLPGGAFSIAGGGEYRSDKIVGDADALSTANAFWSFNGKPISGRIQVTEGYVEAVAPLLRDLSFAHSLELNGAARRTHYKRTDASGTSTDVNVTTWKAGAVYEPIEQIRFRATRSRDIRAPNINELFGPVTLGRTTIVDPANGGAQFQVNAFSGANPQLAPEKANTWTAGVVLAPTWDFARSFRLSVDYFKISVDGAIATLGSQTLINRCSAGATEFCPFVERSGGNIVQIQDVLQNVNQQVNRGIDIESSYRTNIGSLGSLDFRLLATRYLELSTRDTIGVTDRAGQTGFRAGTTTGVPDWTVDGLVSWNKGKLTVTGHGRYLTRGKLDELLVGPEDDGYAVTLANSVSSNRVKARAYFDLSANFRATEQFEFFGAVNNIFDKDPPLAASAQGGTNQVYFDPIGRYFKVGARVRM